MAGVQHTAGYSAVVLLRDNVTRDQERQLVLALQAERFAPPAQLMEVDGFPLTHQMALKVAGSDSAKQAYLAMLKDRPEVASVEVCPCANP